MSLFAPKTPSLDSEKLTIEGERSIPSINQGVGISKRLTTIFTVMCCVILALFLGWRYFSNVAEKRRQATEEATRPDTTQKMEQALPALVVPKPPAPPAPVVVVPSSPSPALSGSTPQMYAPPPTPEKKEPTPEEIAAQRRRLAPVTFAFESRIAPGAGGDGGAGDDGALSRRTSTDDELSRQLIGSATPKARASALKDRNFLITKGTFIEAVMATAMSSDVPGMVKALVTSDVYSSNGRVVLLERGTHLVGEFRGQLKNGQARVFVLWTRAETPQGVVISLDSGTADELGRNGMDGYIDHHWGLRLGSALLLSTWSDALQILADSQRRSPSGDNNFITYDNSSRAAQDMASEALRQFINIPPTLYKNQGDPIRVFVARDLDFKEVYKLGVNDKAMTQLMYREAPRIIAGPVATEAPARAASQ